MKSRQTRHLIEFRLNLYIRRPIAEWTEFLICGLHTFAERFDQQKRKYCMKDKKFNVRNF